MLTPEKIAEMDKVTGLTSANIQQKNIQSRLSELQSLSTPKKDQNIFEKIGNFTGGTKLAQGIAQKIANKTIEKDLGETKKLQDETQKNIIKQMEKNRAEGKDNTKLIKALQSLNNDIVGLGNDTGKLLNQEGLTHKQVIGDALQLGTTIIGSGKIPGVVKSATGATGIVKGAIQGAKTGAITGGAFGASSGVSGALKEDKGALDIVKSGALGALGGAVTGGVLGGTIGGVSGGIKKAAVNKLNKESNFISDLVSPKLTPTVKEQIIKEGRMTEQGILKKASVISSKKDTQLAEAVKDVVSSKKSVVENVDALKNRVGEINDGVKQYITKNKVPFNTKTLSARLNAAKEENKLIFASDATAEKTYNAVVDEFKKYVAKKDTAGLFDARQTFDKVPAIKKLLQTEGLGENTRKQIVLDVRRSANEYIANLLPKGNQYRDQLMQESRMLEVIGNIAEKNTSMIGQNKLQALTKQYPIIKWLIGGLATGVVGAAGVGVGGTIIGSSD